MKQKIDVFENSPHRQQMQREGASFFIKDIQKHCDFLINVLLNWSAVNI